MNEPVVKPSILVKSRIPSNIQEDYPKFVEFVKNYYEYMEEIGQPIELLINSEAYDDIDRTLDSYVNYYKKQFADSIPDNSLVDKRLLVKHILDFYVTKGSEEGFKLFFQMVYGDRIEISYPVENILFTSDGKWTSKAVIQISSNIGDPFKFIGQFVYFIDDDGTVIKRSFVESVSYFISSDTPVFEVVLNNVYVDFDYTDISNSTKLTATIGTETITADLYSMLVDVEVINAGTGYQIGDRSVIYGGGGNGAVVVVDSVNINTGAITSWHIESFGAGYNAEGIYYLEQYYNGLIQSSGGVPYELVVSSDIVVSFPDGDGNALFSAILGKIATYEKYFSGESGMLSSSMRIQDNYYYQKYSYVLSLNKSKEIWESELKRNIHITGTKVFSSVLIGTSVNVADLPLNNV